MSICLEQPVTAGLISSGWPPASDPTKLMPGKIPTRYATSQSDLRATIQPGLNQPTIEVERLVTP